jgi:hypothetical protein
MQLRKSARRWWHVHALAVVIGLLAGALLAGAFATHRHELAVKVGGPHGTKVATITVSSSAAASASEGLADHQGARDETPAGAPRSVIEAAREQQDTLAADDQLPIVTPLAAPEQRGCVTHLVVNYSSRRGVRPRLFVLHYTVSPNRPGWDDVNAVVGEFNTPAFQASSNYVIDNEGHCAYIVRESDKAWTQAAMNPVSLSVEVINTGRESTYAGTVGLAKVALVVSDALKRWAIPVQLGAVSNGVVTRAGIVDHGMLGVAGGGHHDIAPFSVQAVIEAVKHERALEAAAHRPRPKPAWYTRALKLDPMWAWFAWRDHGRPAKLRPGNVPAKVPAAWWSRYARHVGAKA